MVDIRNLDQIQEVEPNSAARRLAPWLLAAVAVGAVGASAILTNHESTESTSVQEEDPLGTLIAKSLEQEGEADDSTASSAENLQPRDATFATILSDLERPSTALVAVKGADGRLIDPESTSPPPAPAPPPGDVLPVVPLPAGSLLHASKITREPKDELGALAAQQATVPEDTEPAARGTAGKYQIQVASFRDPEEAESYAEQLRLRGHEAHTEAARVPGRGLWHRVRIGPFEHKYLALNYKSQFEQREKMATMLVDPHAVKRREEIRAAKLSARAKARKAR